MASLPTKTGKKRPSGVIIMKCLYDSHPTLAIALSQFASEAYVLVGVISNLRLMLSP